MAILFLCPTYNTHTHSFTAHLQGETFSYDYGQMLLQFTWKPVEQQLHRADVQVQLVHMMLTEVTDLEVPENKTIRNRENVNNAYV